MQVFWIELAEPSPANGTGIGVGVTAIDIDDAEVLLQEAFGHCDIASARAINSMDDVEQNHVRPNMGNFLVRGIWFPNYSGW